ncbi:MAG TPA: hypothetical protein VMF13_14600 [Luteitalea sp.]|nr:hypothetical protein [Luteitalea sp.]
MTAGGGDVLRPKEPRDIRAGMVAEVAAHVLALLPVGYWQRRLAARAFALALVPPIPRDDEMVRVRRLRGAVPMLILSTSAMTWGLVPWVWRGEPRLQVREARLAVRRVRAVTAAEACAVVFLSAPEDGVPHQLFARVRLGGPDVARVTVGGVTWAELADILQDASADLDEAMGGEAAGRGHRQLLRLALAS